MAVREIRKYTKSTDLLFPKAPFSRLVREITQELKSDTRYTSQVIFLDILAYYFLATEYVVPCSIDVREQGMLAMHEAAEQFITEKFIKADLARRHAKRETLHIDDLRFTPYMTHIASEIVGNNIKG